MSDASEQGAVFTWSGFILDICVAIARKKLLSETFVMLETRDQATILVRIGYETTRYDLTMPFSIE